MILEWLMAIGLDVTDWISATLLMWPGVAVPQDVGGDIEAMVSSFSGIGVWIPWATVAAAAGVSLAVWLLGLGVKALRALLAHIPAVGGAG